MKHKKRYLSGSPFLKDGYWHIRYRLPDGRDSKRKLGPAWTKRGQEMPPGFWNERTARMELDKLLDKYQGFTPGSDPLFRYAADEWLTWCARDRNLSGTTMKEYQRIVLKNLEPELGKKLLTRITEEDISELRSELFERLAPSSLNQTRIVLAGIIKFARKSRKYRGEDPSEWFDRAPVKVKTAINIYSPTEIEHLARTAYQAGDTQDAAIYKTAGYAGLRLSEIRALRWRDIDFSGEKITIRRRYCDVDGEDVPKSKRPRTMPLAPQLVADLDGLSKRGHDTGPDDLVFCGELGGPLSGSGIYHRFIDCAEAAGLRRLRFHDLRHSYCSMMVRVFPLTDVKEYAGHAQIATTMNYVHFVPQNAAASKLGDLISSSLETPALEPTTEEVSR